MCFSPTADFVAAGVVGVIGVATLRQVRRPRDLAVGALPDEAGGPAAGTAPVSGD